MWLGLADSQIAVSPAHSGWDSSSYVQRVGDLGLYLGPFRKDYALTAAFLSGKIKSCIQDKIRQPETMVEASVWIQKARLGTENREKADSPSGERSKRENQKQSCRALFVVTVPQKESDFI